MAERARRGPATDLFSLCGTAYEMVTGRKPESATDRASGVPLTSMLTVRPELDPSVVSTIEAGMNLKYSDRPQTVQALKELLAHTELATNPKTLFELDAKMVQLQRFTFERRQ